MRFLSEGFVRMVVILYGNAFLESFFGILDECFQRRWLEKTVTIY